VPSEIWEHPQFDVKRLIAEGATSRVFLAQTRDTHKQIALKLLRPELAGNERKFQRFLLRLLHFFIGVDCSTDIA
jgi:serine/threonine protein kinase